MTAGGGKIWACALPAQTCHAQKSAEMREKMNVKCDKLVMAVLQGDDYPDVVMDLNEHGFYVTLLNSSGGFLKKRSVTMLIGLEEGRLEEALQIVKLHAGGRMEPSLQSGGAGMSSLPVQMLKGGIVYFVLNVESSGNF